MRNFGLFSPYPSLADSLSALGKGVRRRWCPPSEDGRSLAPISLTVYLVMSSIHSIHRGHRGRDGSKWGSYEYSTVVYRYKPGPSEFINDQRQRNGEGHGGRRGQGSISQALPKKLGNQDIVQVVLCIPNTSPPGEEQARITIEKVLKNRKRDRLEWSIVKGISITPRPNCNCAPLDRSEGPNWD